MKLCNDKRKAQVFNLFIYLLLPYVWLKLVHYVGHYTISFQNARSLQHKKNFTDSNLSNLLVQSKYKKLVDKIAQAKQ
jgi:hypothetical protein